MLLIIDRHLKDGKRIAGVFVFSVEAMFVRRINLLINIVFKLAVVFSIFPLNPGQIAFGKKDGNGVRKKKK